MFRNPSELHLKEEAVHASERTQFIVIIVTNQLMVLKWRQLLFTVRIVKKHDMQTVRAEGGVSNDTAGGSHAYRSALKGYGTVTEQQQGANTYCYR